MEAIAAWVLRSALGPTFFLVLVAGHAHALDPNRAITQYMHDSWSVDKGLPSSVRAIAQTPDGYLWLATQEGLVRFDGIRFDIFDKERVPELRSSELHTLFVASDGVLWIGSHGGGVTRMKDERFTPIKELGSDGVLAFAEGPDGVLWVGTAAGGLKRLEGTSVRVFTTKEGLPSNSVAALLKDRKGVLWVGLRSGGICRLDQDRCTVFGVKEGLPSDQILTLYKDPGGTLWAGTRKGLSRLEGNRFVADGPSDKVFAIRADRDGNLWLGVTAGDTGYNGLVRKNARGIENLSKQQQGLSHDNVRALFEDLEGNLWIGTLAGGLNRLRNSKLLTYSTPEGLTADIIWPIIQDRAGAMWIGTDGSGLFRFEGGRFTRYTIKEGLPSQQVSSLLEDSAGNLWVGTIAGLSRLRDGKFTTFTTRDGLGSDVILSILEDRDGSLWIGTNSGGLNHWKDGRFEVINTSHGLPHDNVISLHQDRAGRLWIGTAGGLSRLENGKLTSFSEADGVPRTSMPVLYGDAEGSIWIGTMEHGVVRWKDDRFVNFTTQQGLFDQVAFSILEDRAGHLWISCNKGIYRVSKHELEEVAAGRSSRVHSVAFGRGDGMRAHECNGTFQPSGWAARDGRLWFPTVKGVVVVDPEHLPINQFRPPVVIQQVVVDGVPANATSEITLPPGTKTLEFHYTGLSFFAPEKVRFRYQLEGFDGTLVEAQTRRVAYYSNLSPGQYRFRVIASNNDGIWNEQGASITLTQTPYVYQTRWFSALALLAVGLVVAGGYRLRVRSLNERNRLLEAQVSERTRSLKQANARLAEIDQAKTKFFSNISHEFRTPLTLIIGPLEDAVAGAWRSDPAELHHQHEIMLRNARRLLRLVNQLLDIARLEAGRMRLRAIQKDLVLFLKGIVSSFSGIAERKQITLEVTAPEAPVMLWFDPEKLEKVFFNLLSNALKFTPEHGRVRVTVTSERESPEGGVRVAVRDSGPGISREDLPHVFDRFAQAQRPTTAEALRGTGIGLSLARELVQLHGGSMTVASEPGFGAELVVELPRGRQHLASEQVVDGEEPPQDAAPDALMTRVALSELDTAAASKPVTLKPGADAPTLLVIDDNQDLRRYMQGALGSQYRIIEACDGEEGLRIARESSPDLIISDVMMPQLDGYDLCRALKSDATTNHIPVILLTAKGSEDSKVEGLQAGADDYIAKPFDTRELTVRVRNLLQLRRQERELKALSIDLEKRIQEALEVILRGRRLARYLPRPVVDQLLRSERDDLLAPERRNLTILCSGLTGFTALTDRSEPERITGLLKEYFTEMTALIEQHGGTPDKLMGEGLMVLWGAPEPLDIKEQARRAVALAVAMQHKMKALRKKWWAEDGTEHELQIRIGIHQGYVTVGSIGSERLMTYTAIGGGVNVASHLERICTPGRILVSFPVYTHTCEAYPWGPEVEQQVAGLTRPVRTFEFDPTRQNGNA